MEALLERELQSGRFQYPSDLIESALHALAESRPYSAAELDQMIQEGIDGVERGDVYTEEEARAYLASVRAKL